MPPLTAIARLTRIDSSLLAVLAIFTPLVTRTGNVAVSFGRSIPLLFICVCTFIANDLDDLEKDRLNHPERALPSRDVTPVFAAVLYFTSLAAALLSTWHYVTERISFLYYALMVLAISYTYVVEWVPSLKAPYVGVVSSVPVLIVASWYPNEMRLYSLAAVVFLLTLGRELCMDIKDRPGDPSSLIQRMRPIRLAIFAFTVQGAAVILLLSHIRSVVAVFVWIAMLGLLASSTVFWFRFAKLRGAIVVMKLQLFAGLYFLI